MFKRIISVLVILFSLNTSRADPTAQIFSPKTYGEGSLVEAIAAVRFSFDEKLPNGSFFEGARRIKLVTGTQFGWLAIVNVTEGVETVWVEESFTVPKPPKKWGNINPSDISKDRRTVTQRRELAVFNYGGVHLTGGVWTLAEGDPEGVGEIVVRIEGRDVAKFLIEFFR